MVWFKVRVIFLGVYREVGLFLWFYIDGWFNEISIFCVFICDLNVLWGVIKCFNDDLVYVVICWKMLWLGF